MAYCTVEDVQADFKGLVLSETTLVKLSSVQKFIVEADSVINSYVSKKYSVPAYGNEMLSMISRSLVANRVRGIMEVKEDKNNGANQNVRSGLSTKDLMQMLKDIGNGDLPLSGLAPANVGASGFNSYNVDNCVLPVMNKDRTQW